MSNLANRLSSIIENAIKAELYDSCDSSYPFLNVEDYIRKTGKRFRMTKSQKDSGMTREQAFREFMENMMDK